MWRQLLSLTLLPLAVACSGTDSAEGDVAEGASLPTIKPVEPDFPPIAYRQLDLAVRSPDGQRTATFRVYDPENNASLIHGLMGVTDLPPDAGMLFRFKAPQQQGGFWMKNTLIPLSIAFADSQGAIEAILDMEPCNADPCPSFRPDAAFQYALEVNRGAFRSSGVEEGWRLDVPAELPPAPR
jgi:uncharacterized membrane protein (UPF0127 family)